MRERPLNDIIINESGMENLDKSSTLKRPDKLNLPNNKTKTKVTREDSITYQMNQDYYDIHLGSTHSSLDRLNSDRSPSPPLVRILKQGNYDLSDSENVSVDFPKNRETLQISNTTGNKDSPTTSRITKKYELLRRKSSAMLRFLKSDTNKETKEKLQSSNSINTSNYIPSDFDTPSSTFSSTFPKPLYTSQNSFIGKGLPKISVNNEQVAEEDDSQPYAYDRQNQNPQIQPNFLNKLDRTKSFNDEFMRSRSQTLESMQRTTSYNANYNKNIKHSLKWSYNELKNSRQLRPINSVTGEPSYPY